MLAARDTRTTMTPSPRDTKQESEPTGQPQQAAPHKQPENGGAGRARRHRGLRDLLDKSKKQKEAAAEQEKEALLNGSRPGGAAPQESASRPGGADHGVESPDLRGVDFQVKAVEERINAKLPELTKHIEQRLDKVESSLGESFHAIETLISSLSAGKRKARDLLVAQAVTAFSHVSVHMTDEQRVTLVQKRVRGFLRRKRIAAREDATARALAELAAFKETTKRELEEAARARRGARRRIGRARRGARRCYEGEGC